MTNSPTRSVTMTPPARSLALEDDDRAFPLAQFVGGRESGDAGADDGDIEFFRHDCAYACASLYR